MTAVYDAFAVVLKAVNPDDPTGHLPNCGYTDARPVCGCADVGGRLFKALAQVITTAEVAALRRVAKEARERGDIGKPDGGVEADSWLEARARMAEGSL